MYTLLVSHKVIKFIKKLPRKQQELVNSKFEKLKKDPFNHPELDLKKMQNKTSLYRLRVGRIRFIYEVDKRQVIILIFTGDVRGGVYKK